LGFEPLTLHHKVLDMSWNVLYKVLHGMSGSSSRTTFQACAHVNARHGRSTVHP
jgi:hypothetical protein